jgi:hypothetical protein
VTTVVSSTHLDRAAILLLDKVQRLLAKVDAEIASETEKLEKNLELVETYPFSKWGSTLGDKIEGKLRRSIDKYELDVANTPQYTQHIATLSKHVIDKVHLVEITQRRAWNAAKEAKAEAERNAWREENKRRTEQYERDMKEKDEKMAQESARLRDEAKESRKQMEEAFGRQIQEQNRLNEEREKTHQAHLQAMEAARQAAEREAAALRNQGGGGGGDGCLLL